VAGENASTSSAHPPRRKVLTDSKDVKQYIKRMLSRDEQLKNNRGTICTLVEMEAASFLPACPPSYSFSGARQATKF